jgi:hypothetical protein
MILYHGVSKAFPTLDLPDILSNARSYASDSMGYPTLELLLKAFTADGYIPGCEIQHGNLETFASFLSTTYSDMPQTGTTDPYPASISKLADEFIRCINNTMQGRTLCLPESGKFAIGPRAQHNDMICVLHGCTHPVLLSPHGDGTFRMRGTCYLKSWMDPWKNGKIDWMSMTRRTSS